MGCWLGVRVSGESGGSGKVSVGLGIWVGVDEVLNLLWVSWVLHGSLSPGSDHHLLLQVLLLIWVDDLREVVVLRVDSLSLNHAHSWLRLDLEILGSAAKLVSQTLDDVLLSELEVSIRVQLEEVLLSEEGESDAAEDLFLLIVGELRHLRKLGDLLVGGLLLLLWGLLSPFLVSG